jgi:hypothetical protein
MNQFARPATNKIGLLSRQSVSGGPMYLRTSRHRGSALAVIGGCLAVYVGLAVAYHWWVEPTVRNPGVVADRPAAAMATTYLVAAARLEEPPPLRFVPKSQGAATAAAVEVTDVTPKKTQGKRVARARQARPAYRRSWDFAFGGFFNSSRRPF